MRRSLLALRRYVQRHSVEQVKRLVCAEEAPESSLVHGVVFCKNVVHRRMRSAIVQPRILLLRGSLEYERTNSTLSSLSTSLEQVLPPTPPPIQPTLRDYPPLTNDARGDGQNRHPQGFSVLLRDRNKEHSCHGSNQAARLGYGVCIARQVQASCITQSLAIEVPAERDSREGSDLRPRLRRSKTT